MKEFHHRTVLKCFDAVADRSNTDDGHDDMSNHKEIEESSGGATAFAHVIVQLCTIRIRLHSGGLRGNEWLFSLLKRRVI